MSAFVAGDVSLTMVQAFLAIFEGVVIVDERPCIGEFSVGEALM